MAVRTPTGGRAVDGSSLIFQYTWTGLLTGDTGAPIIIPWAHDAVVEMFGTGGSAVNSQISFETTGDPAAAANWVATKNPQGNANTSTAGLGAVNIKEAVQDVALHVRPNVIGGDGGTTYTVRLTLRVQS